MSVIVGLAVSFILLMFCVIKGLYIGYALAIATLIFIVIAYKKGYSMKNIWMMLLRGSRNSYVIGRILLLIGGVIGIWMATGVIPAIVYYCFQFIAPSTFILACFLLSAITSFLIGTALGTASTMGVPLIIIANSSDISISLVAGAIMSGCYFGDRCSPMSSSANLVASLTNTDLFVNVKNMLKTTILPLLMSIVIYGYLSVKYPLNILNNEISGQIMETFQISYLMLLPAALMIVLCILRTRVDKAILISIFASIVLFLFSKEANLLEILKSMILGFALPSESPLHTIIKGGGMISMVKTVVVVYISCALAGIFKGIDMFEGLKNKLKMVKWSPGKLFLATSITTFATAAFGCTQAICIIMAKEIMGDCYKDYGDYEFALDLENSGILFSALIPWNLAAMAPTTTMGVSMAGFIPFAFMTYLVPVVFLIGKFIKK